MVCLIHSGHFFQGDLSECFKSRALSSLDDFFTKDSYELSEHTRVVRMPNVQLRMLQQEPFEYSTEPRVEDSEWDQLVKFVMRKVRTRLKNVLTYYYLFYSCSSSVFVYRFL